MKRGFYTGLAAVLAMFALSVLWMLAESQSDRQVSDLIQFQALSVSERSQDSLPYLFGAVADAESDSAFSVHGCTLTPGTFCPDVQARILNYSSSASGTLSVSPVSVFGLVSGFVCAPFSVPLGYTNAYSVNGTLNVTLIGGPVKAVRAVPFSDVVLINSTGTPKSFRAIVNRSGIGVVWDVSVNCP